MRGRDMGGAIETWTSEGPIRLIRLNVSEYEINYLFRVQEVGEVGFEGWDDYEAGKDDVDEERGEMRNKRAC